ncbi:hypothetical protein [Bernardetia sp.]|uniref:hypothetical protein n=1 Tax=Bernardetia sp. TaxID=1937974 RepID=UPI0025C059AC|nr:hypothetical protein [Bernardetia sp.]
MINLSNLQKDKVSTAQVVADIGVLILVLINLTLIVFNFLFSAHLVQDFLKEYLNSFYHFYHDYVFKNFALIDLVFVGIFITDIIVRWAIAIYLNTYHRWFFYPFIHWYDVLGCLPSFRSLRVLRLAAILYKLHLMKVINLSDTYIYKTAGKYFSIFVEEVSDRVVINVLNEVQGEVMKGSPIVEKIVEDVIQPRSNLLTTWVTKRVQVVAAQNYPNYKYELRRYVEALINEAVENNAEIKTIGNVPIMGEFIAQNLERAIADIVFNVVNQLVEDATTTKDNRILKEVTDILVEALLIDTKSQQQFGQITKGMISEALELIKKQVAIKQWKVRELEEKEFGFSPPAQESIEEIEAEWEQEKTGIKLTKNPKRK